MKKESKYEKVDAEDADGVAFKVYLEKTPEFCEITFNDALCLMIEFNGRWFFKDVSTKTIDLMPVFFCHKIFTIRQDSFICRQFSRSGLLSRH